MSRKGITFPGLAEYVGKIYTLDEEKLKIVQGAAAQGAKIVADICKDELQSLPTTSEGSALQAWKKQETVSLTKRQKDGLIESMGLAPMQNDRGFINTKLGFDGYNEVVTKKWPKGQPNQMIARSVESGSSVFKKNPFMRRTEKAAAAKAEKAMEKYFDEHVNRIMK